MLRRCARCRVDKPMSDYTTYPNANGPGRPKTDSYCRACRADYGREHYARNKPRYIENAMRRTNRVLRTNTRLLVDYLGDHPCVDCGETDPLVLEFDHQRDKRFEIASGVRDKSWEHVLLEIKKCEVVCANCHRRRTAKAWGFAKVVLGVTEPQLPLF